MPGRWPFQDDHPGALIRWCLWILLALMVSWLGGCASSGSHFSQWDRASPASAHRLPPGAVHRVRPGDTLYSIAMAHNLDWQALARWNGIHDPRALRVGQVLYLTDPARRPASPTSAAHAQPARPAAEKPPARETASGAASTAAAPTGTVLWQWPADGTVVSRFIDDSKTQPGLILRGTIGAPVRASAAGEVVYAGDGLPGYGNLLIIKHNAAWLSAYGYNQALKVKEGDRVAAGQIIATMGRRDNRSTAAEGSLLFQIRHNGEPVDPLPLLPVR